MLKTNIPNVNISWKRNNTFDLVNDDGLSVGQIYSVCVSPISTRHVLRFRERNVVAQMRAYDKCLQLTQAQCSQVVKDYYSHVDKNPDFCF